MLNWLRRHCTSMLSKELTQAKWALRFAMFLCAGLFAFLLRFDLCIPPTQYLHAVTAISAWLLVKPLAFRLLRLDLYAWRYVSIRDLAVLVRGNVVASLVSAVPIAVLAGTSFPRSIYMLDLIVCSACTCAMRVIVRLLADRALETIRPEHQRVIIYGAGAAGILLLREIRSNGALKYNVVGFVDDDEQKLKLRLYGVPVLGSGADLLALSKRFEVEQVLIAIPSASGTQMVRILDNCRRAGVKRKTMPSMGEIINGSGVCTVREVAVEDLLGRTPVRLDAGVIRDQIERRTILVTGAAGSIGSELCRQIARFHPRKIVAFDISETGSFYLEREMRSAFPDVDFVAEIGSIQNPTRLREVIGQNQPYAIYHAAAYKHVPLMEHHVVEAVENNIIGTHNLIAIASELHVARFVMISSDKAVRPTNVMGATKRVAELIVKAYQNGTNCVSVRFGNVLGSNGSVIPIFRQQIAAGGPVEVTHPDIRRYFMTIPEAAQLVLQAAALGNGGEIFVLDMGQPVLIRDLAASLIELSGLRTGEDIRIVYTGLRPGEKLFEELNLHDEETRPSPHEKIQVFAGASLEFPAMMQHLDELYQLVRARDAAALIRKLKELVPDYAPSHYGATTHTGSVPEPEQATMSLKNLAVAIGSRGVETYTESVLLEESALTPETA